MGAPFVVVADLAGRCATEQRLIEPDVAWVELWIECGCHEGSVCKVFLFFHLRYPLVVGVHQKNGYASLDLSSKKTRDPNLVMPVTRLVHLR